MQTEGEIQGNDETLRSSTLESNLSMLLLTSYQIL